MLTSFLENAKINICKKKKKKRGKLFKMNSYLLKDVIIWLKPNKVKFESCEKYN